GGSGEGRGGWDGGESSKVLVGSNGEYDWKTVAELSAAEIVEGLQGPLARNVDPWLTTPAFCEALRARLIASPKPGALYGFPRAVLPGLSARGRLNEIQRAEVPDSRLAPYDRTIQDVHRFEDLRYPDSMFAKP